VEEKLLELFHRRNYTPSNISELLSRLGLPPNQKKQLERTLARLERAGQIARIKQGNRYALPLEADLVPGRIRMNRQGVGVLQPDDPKIPALRIPHDATATAMHGDHVLVRKDVVPRKALRGLSGEPTGRIVRVLERARTKVVGTLQRGRELLYVVPDDPRIPHDVYVPAPRDVGRPARVGDKVVVELREWKSRNANPEGEIVEVLGAPDAEGVDMLSILRQYHLPLHFPKRVLQEANSFGHEVKPKELPDRTDCREHQVITIDPQDAKDFDDAICLQAVPGHRWKLWVHIADVSHYVKPGTALDEEAARRGNSTYLVDRVIPMLPEALSNELCSLKPHVERLTKCVEFLLSNEGQVLRTQFYPAVIRSQCRFNYKEALAILQRPPQDSIEGMLHDANGIAQKIRRLRFKAGSLDLDFPERKILLDDAGKVLRIEKVENDISHQLIEEFMLLANEAVAGRLMALGRPAIYRIHEPPDEKRLEEYREDVLSHNIHCGNLLNRREVQKLLEKLNSLAIGQALKIGFLRSLMRARYATQPLGHYGLAKQKYTHFTSPIRRYADLIVHRALFQPARNPLAAGNLQEIAGRISETERNSDDAERDSRDVKLFAFLQAQLKTLHPQRYNALVTDVRNFGFFVDVPGLGMSGLVPLSGLVDDFYNFDSTRNQLIGRRTRRVIRLGDKLEVQAAKVDTFKRQVDFRLAGQAGTKHQKR
jgi:ribonuclease R